MSKRRSNADSHFEDLFGARTGESLSNTLKLIPPEKIERLAQPRVSFPEPELQDLADSIRDLNARGEGIEGTGLLQPLLVTENGVGEEYPYRLIAGERRYRASEIVGLTNLPCLVVQMGHETIRVAQLVENMQRQNLAPLEEAAAIQSLMQDQKLSLRETAKALGKGKGYVENRLALLKMGSDVQEMVTTKADTLLHAREIDSVTDPAVRSLLIEAVLHEGLSRSLLRERIENHVSAPEVSVRTDTSGETSPRQPKTSAPEAPSLKTVIEKTRTLSEQLPQLLVEDKANSSWRRSLHLEIQELKSVVTQLEQLLKGK